MRLSQIKIAGFKSFVDPTKIVFPGDIVGIVGPNGCGKSNVIDAVRWVMGESSARNLRGESMEDVIFSGSSGRKPIGQASVELIFDNSAGRVKGEYAKYNEISVKRIASRAGQSKYYLNNTRCRRRDIADIFLGTGLGPRSYSIIEQGMVSRIIDARPDDLRVYLEEAAGISKYKERRRETENRIRHTRENIDRLVDLIEEIDKQIARLDRQSKTAEKFKTLKQQQRRLQAECLLLERQTFDRDYDEQKRQLGIVETGMEQCMAKMREVEAEIETCRQQLAEASENHNRIQGDFYRLGAEISSAEQSIENQETLRRHNQKELEAVQQLLESAEKGLQVDTVNLQKLDLAGEQNQPQLKQSSTALEQHTGQWESAESSMHAWQQQWDQFRQQFHQVHEAAQIENRSIEHIERQLQQLENRRQRLQQELDSLDSSILAREIEELEASVESKAQEHIATVTRSQSRGGDIQELRQLIDEQSAQLDERRSRLQTLRGQLSSLEVLQQQLLAEESDELQQWLVHSRIRPGSRLTEKLRVKDQLEKAVEVVLSPFLAGYCLEPGESIPINVPANIGVAMFDRNRTGVNQDSTRNWEKLGDYVQSEVDLSALLHGVYVCRDQQQLNQRRALLEPGESLVTSDGLWAGSNWSLQLGDDDQRAGMLQREQEIVDIRAQLAQITESAMALKSRNDGDRQRLQLLEKEWDEDQRSLNLMQQNLSDVQQQLNQREVQIEQLQNRRGQLQQELAELDESSTRHQSELQSSRVKRNDYLLQIEAKSTREEELLQHKESLQRQLGESRLAVQQAREQFQQLQMDQQKIESEQTATQANIERMARQSEQYNQRLEELNRVIEGSVQPVNDLKVTLQSLLKSRGQGDQEMSRSQQAVGELDNRQRELEARRHQQQQRVDDSRNQLESQRLLLQEVKIRGDSIEDQLRKTGQDVATILAELSTEAELGEWTRTLEQLGARIERLGPINLAAIEEYKEQAERKQYLDAQHQDLLTALETLESAIRKIDRETRDRFKETFDRVNSRISERFPRLFGGGEAHLEMTENDLLNTGVQIMARPPGKRVTNLQLLSGGEKALTAVALIFAIFELNPSPFCMLDEVDAPLDDANVGRFCAMVEEMSEQVQFIMITHNKITMSIARNLNGVTMHEPGVSRLVSVDVSEAVELAGVE